MFFTVSQFLVVDIVPSVASMKAFGKPNLPLCLREMLKASSFFMEKTSTSLWGK